MLDELFTFPIVMIDGDNEERKIKDKEQKDILGLNKDDAPEEEYDMVFGEAEYPYWDFIGVEDRWLPSTESFQKALQQKFDGCIVRFLHAGQLLVPWSKKKFKAELAKFQEQYEINHPPKQPERPKQTVVMALPFDQYKKIIDDGSNKTEG